MSNGAQLAIATIAESGSMLSIQNGSLGSGQGVNEGRALAGLQVLDPIWPRLVQIVRSGGRHVLTDEVD